MKIIKKKITDLSQDPANVRKHPEKNLQAIIASLRRFGQQHPIVIDVNNTVRSGNGRLQAAIALGWDEIDCVVTELKGSEAIAYAIADNRTAELAEWDDDILAAQLNGLLTDDEELVEAAGFTDKELADLFDKLDESEKDSPSFDEDADVQSGVRMVQLFLDDSNIEEFQSACAKLAEAYQTLNITDTVLEAIRRESSLL